MYYDIGKKIKMLTIWIVGFGMVATIVLGIIELSNYSKMIESATSSYYSYSSSYATAKKAAEETYSSLLINGLVTLIIGPVACWIGGLMFYGFGELVDRTCEIRNMYANLYSTEVKKNYKAITLEDKVKYGIISREAYEKRRNGTQKDN